MIDIAAITAGGYAYMATLQNANALSSNEPGSAAGPQPSSSNTPAQTIWSPTWGLEFYDPLSKLED
jgi:hypothetical protein